MYEGKRGEFFYQGIDNEPPIDFTYEDNFITKGIVLSPSTIILSLFDEINSILFLINNEWFIFSLLL